MKTDVGEPLDQGHQVGITNAQENNSDLEIASKSKEMNLAYKSGDYEKAAELAVSITAISKDELRDVFVNRGVKIIHLDHEAFGIYKGRFEPTYDLLVDGNTADILSAAREFGAKHAQQAILVARILKEGDHGEGARLGATITLGKVINSHEAVAISEEVLNSGFSGATFSPKRQGTIIIYNSQDLGMTNEEFKVAYKVLLEKFAVDYPDSQLEVGSFMLSLGKP